MLPKNSTRHVTRVLRSDCSKHPEPLTLCPPAQSSNQKYSELNIFWSLICTIYKMDLERCQRGKISKRSFRCDLLEGPRNWGMIERPWARGGHKPKSGMSHRAGCTRLLFQITGFQTIEFTVHASVAAACDTSLSHPVCIRWVLVNALWHWWLFRTVFSVI